MHRPHQLPPPHLNLDPPDLGPCPTPPTPPLTLLASTAQSRRLCSCTLTSALSHLTPNPLQQWLLLLLPSPSPLPPRRGRAPLLLRQGLSRWPSPSQLHSFFFFLSTFYNATVHNTCIAYLQQSLQVIGERGEGLYEGQSDVTLGDRSCGTQPQRTGVKDAGYGRPVRAKLRQGVGPQLRWLRRRRRSQVAPNRSGTPT
jgi:hypothetical protein